MKLVVDANILFSAIIKDGVTRHLLLHPEVSAYSPEFIAREFLEHKTELALKAGLSEEELNRTKLLLLNNIRLVGDSTLSPYLPAAESLTSDKDDWIYFAASLALGADLWTNDKGAKTQQRIKVWTTAELLKRLGLPLF